MRATAVRIVVALGAAGALVLLPPDRRGWSAVAAAAFDGALPPRFDDVAALVAGTALWVLAAWVLVALLAGWAAALPGVLGVGARLVVCVCVPRALRAIVLGGVAGGLLLGPAVAAGASPVWPTTPPASAPTTPGPAWPTHTPPATAPPTTATPPPAPTPPAPSTPAPTPPAPTTPKTGAASVVVTPGDSLWSISGDALQAAGVTPTNAKVAAAWPTWYAANRAVIGADPGLLRPGTSLTAPTTTGGSTP